MSLMGSLYVGSSGLRTSQNALHTVAHNLANAHTVGYTRQQTLQADRAYNTISVNKDAISNQQIGLGTQYAAVRQVRDFFLDRTFRKESGRAAFYEVSFQTLREASTLLGEMLEGVAFAESLGDLWTAIEELAKDPSSAVNQGLLVRRAEQFLGKATAVYDGLANLQDNLNFRVDTMVARINEIGRNIRQLNEQILKVEAGKVENANDLRDQRNLLLDELGTLVNMSYKEEENGVVTVSIEGSALVTPTMLFDIGIQRDPMTGFATPYWVMNARAIGETASGETIYDISSAKLFDLEQTISTANDTDIGALKAVLLARGTHRADYTDLNPDTYNDLVSQSIIMNTQAQFDFLIHSVATQINRVLREAADEDLGYLIGSDGNPIQLFQKMTTPSFDPITGAYIRESTAPGDEETLYTIKNMRVNPDLVKQPALLGFRHPELGDDMELMKRLQEVFTAQSYISQDGIEVPYTLNPNIVERCNLIDYYSQIIGQVANAEFVFKGAYQESDLAVREIENKRQQVQGVMDDEELAGMIRFQNAYNASSRYITVIDEMLTHLLQALGR